MANIMQWTSTSRLRYDNKSQSEYFFELVSFLIKFTFLSLFWTNVSPTSCQSLLATFCRISLHIFVASSTKNVWNRLLYKSSPEWRVTATRKLNEGTTYDIDW